MIWLFKEEPRKYSYTALEKDGGTCWSGVRNPLAQKHIRAVREGDRVLYYHTGRERAIVGIATAVSDAYADPDDGTGKCAAVDIAPSTRLPHPVTLEAIKSHPAFATSPLVRIPRLSVMPVTAEQLRAIESIAGHRAASPLPPRERHGARKKARGPAHPRRGNRVERNRP